MYLVHLICLSFLQRVLRPTTGFRTWLLLFATILLSLAVAEVLYRLIEHPCIAAGRRLQERWLHSRKPQEIASPALK
jgi:peptidoglycan/LPS O-acetylase OafA/YrhL